MLKLIITEAFSKDLDCMAKAVFSIFVEASQALL